LKHLPLLTLFLLLAACQKNDLPISKNGFTDNFDRNTLGANWFDTIGRFVLANNSLNIQGGYNHPLWLKKKIPVNVDIEFNAKSMTSDGDIKIELFGDGKSFALNRGAYVATGYVFCQGGWKNKKTFIAKRFEHDRKLLHTTKAKVNIGKYHHWKIVSRKKEGALILTWFIDGKKILSMKDLSPIYGSKNQWFAFSNWASDTWFDNLKITPKG
jgi:hypothetical protein